MKYDKDIRTCRLLMTIIGLAQFPAAAAVYTIERNWVSAVVCFLWGWACYVVRRSMEVQQTTRDAQRLITATLEGRLAEEIERRDWSD
jgi:predicted MFS family arabinose efflux permease